ncbi:PRC-barrel domain-containing protein [Streptomyces sp. NPDC052682]|uniref:PRC-barrel domain-containing protein n=1 Tax=Streptomyces sp. NPDC052682 TaxID=3154954 RepID=UPI0034472D1F
MRLADLMGARIMDADGREVGHVSDVRLVEERVLTADGAGLRMRVEGLVVAVRRRGRLLAYDHRPVDRPRLLARLVSRATARARYAPWDRVAAHQPPASLGQRGTVQLTVRAQDLTPLSEVHDDWNRRRSQ